MEKLSSSKANELLLKVCVFVRAKKFIHLIVPLACLILTVLIYYPGYMSHDSVMQLQQARSDALTDWHPPLMSWLWRKFDAVWPGPIGMLVFHNLLFWTGLSLLIYLLIPARTVAWLLIVGLGFFPPVIALLGTIWKDVGMAVALLLACALLFHAEQKGSKITWWLALPFLFYGLAVRHNALFAVIPLVLWAASIAVKLYATKTSQRIVTVLVIGLTLQLALILAARFVNNWLTYGQKPSLVHQVIYAHDLVAVAVRTGVITLPAYLQPSFTYEELRDIYTPDEIVPLFCCNTEKRRFAITTNEEEVAQWERLWLRTIPTHPLPYLAHRLNVFLVQLGVSKEHVCLPFQPGTIDNTLGVPTHHTRLNRALMWRLEHLQDSILFRGWFYLILLVIWLSLAVKVKNNSYKAAKLAISCSGLCYLLAYFFISVTCDFRMNWWSVIAALLIPLFWLPSTMEVWQQRINQIITFFSEGEITIRWKLKSSA